MLNAKCSVCNQPINEQNGYIQEKKVNGAKIALYICESCKQKEEANAGKDVTDRKETNPYEMVLWSLIGGIVGIVSFSLLTVLTNYYVMWFVLIGPYTIYYLEKRFVNKTFKIVEKIYLVSSAIVFFFVSMYIVSILSPLKEGLEFSMLLDLLQADPLIFMSYVMEPFAWFMLVGVAVVMWSVLPSNTSAKSIYRKI